jgi:hypothetical protein
MWHNHRMSKSFIVACIALVFAALFLGWGYFPLETRTASFVIDNLDDFAWLRGYTVTLNYPARARVGEAVSARLILTPPPVAAPVMDGQAAALAEARWDFPLAQIRPPGETLQALTPGAPLSFFWQVQLETPGTYQGAVWLVLQTRAEDGALETRVPVSAQLVEIRAEGLAGLDSGTARGVGWGAFLLAIILLAPRLLARIPSKKAI